MRLTEMKYKNNDCRGETKRLKKLSDCSYWRKEIKRLPEEIRRTEEALLKMHVEIPYKLREYVQKKRDGEIEPKKRAGRRGQKMRLEW